MGRRVKIILLSVPLLVIAGTYLALSLGFFLEPLQREARALLSRHLHESVYVGEIGFRLIPLSLRLRDVILPNPDDATRPFVSVHRIDVVLSPWSWLTETVIVRKIQFREPRVDLTIRPDGAGGPDWIGSLLKSPNDSGPTSVRAPAFIVRQIEVQDGRFQIHDPQREIGVDLAGIDAKIFPNLRMRNFFIRITGRTGTFRRHHLERQLHRMEASLSIRPDSIEIQKAAVRSNEMELAVSGTANGWPGTRYALVLDASFPIAEAAEFLDLKQNWAGLARLHAEWTGREGNFSIGGDAAVENLALDDTPIGRIKTVFHYKDGLMNLSEIRYSVQDGEARGEASLDFNRRLPSYRLSVALDRIPARPFFSLLVGKDGLRNQILKGRMELSGRGLERASLSGQGDLHAEMKQDRPASDSKPVEWTEWTGSLEEAAVRYEMDAGLLLIKEASARTARSGLDFQGRIGRENQLDLSFRLISSEADELAPLIRISLRGEADLKGSVRGTLREPQMEADGVVRQAVFWGRPFERISGHLSYRHPLLALSSAQFLQGEARYELDGRLSFDPNLPEWPFFELKARIHRGHPHEVIAMFYADLPISTTATGTLQVQGLPREFKLTADLDVGAGAIYGQKLDEGRLDLIVTHKDVSFRNVRAKHHDSVVTGEGWIGYDGSFKMSVATAETHLEDLSWAQTLLGEISGVASGKLAGSGPIRRPSFRGTAEIQKIAYRRQPFGNGALTATVQDETLSLNVSLDSGLSSQGVLTLKDPYPFQAQMDMNQFQAGPILKLIPSSFMAKVSSEATGRLTVQGHLGRLADSNARLRLTEIRLDLAGYPLSNEEEVRIQFARQTLQIDSLRLKGKDTGLAISGGLEWQRNYNLVISGEADLNLLRIFSKEIASARGRAQLAIQILDRWDRPEIRGSLQLQDGMIKPETLKQPILLHAMALSFNQRQVILQSLEGDLGGGRISAGGRLDLAGFSVDRFGLHFELTGGRIKAVQGLTAVVDTMLLFEGDTQARRLKGEVVIQKAAYSRRVDWQGLVVDLIQREKRESSPTSMIDDIQLNVQIRGEDDIEISNNLAKLPLQLDLLVKGTIGQPVLLGRVEANGGTMSFRGNDFKILSGTLDFIDLKRIRPIIDIKATTLVRDHQIDLNLSGPIDRVDLSLSSDPPLKDETEILALLTFGKTPQEIANTSKEIGAEEAINVLTTEIQEVVEERVAGLTGLERIHVEPYYSSARTSGTPRVSVSKRLYQDKLYVTYGILLGPSGEDELQIEYILNKNISLVGGRDDQARVGGDLKFRFAFR